jgi:hypothetical protein
MKTGILGRPSKYDGVKIKKEFLAYIKECEKKKNVPTIEGFSLFTEITRVTFYEWANPKSDQYHEDFSYIFDNLKTLQADILLQGGVKGIYNATITKLMLSKHDYIDTNKQELTGKDGGPLEIQGVEIAIRK